MDNVKALRVANDQTGLFKLGLDGDFNRQDAGGDSPRVTPLQTIWNRRLLVCIIVGVCGIAFGLYAKSRTKIYTRSCQIVIEPANAKVIGEGMNMESYLNTQAELINNASAIHVDAIGILREKQEKGLIALHSIGTGGDDLAMIRDGISATPGRNADIVTVQFNSPYSDEAAYILSAVAEAYEKFISLDNHKASNDNYASIRSDKEKWEKEMHEQHGKIADLEGEVMRLQTDEGLGNGDAKHLLVLADELNSARLHGLDAKIAFERIAKSSMPDPARLEDLLRTGLYNGQQILVGNDEGQIKAELYAARQKLNDLKERYLPNHPAVQAAQVKVDDRSAAYVLHLNREWVSTNLLSKQLEATYGEQKATATKMAREIRSQLATRQAQINDVKESLDQNKKLTGLLRTRMEEITSLDHQGAVRIHLISDPDPKGPPDRIRPNTNMLVLEGLLVGLILGLTVAFVDQRLRSVNEVVAATSLPILGVIPHMSNSLSQQTRGRKVHLDPMSDVAEAFRGVRTAVHFGPKAKTVLVTSAERGEGKSTLAANLAIAIAEAGQRVLIVDADLREPTQHKIFSATNDNGVSSVVAGRSSTERAIQSTGIRGLELMPCGPIPFNPSETINNQMFADLLTDLAAKYDFVIVDSPPVMAVTDARILGAMCDLTVMVVRAEKSNRRSAADARDGLLGFGANLLGIVVNDGTRSRQRYGYYGGYGSRANGAPGLSRADMENSRVSPPDLIFASDKR